MENRRNRNKKSGFTLIELVVVIAIIGILAAVITPRVRTALLKARDGRAVATMDALRTASNVYFAEKGTVLNPEAVNATNSSLVTKMTMKELKILQNAGYLDAKALKQLDPLGTNLDATEVEVEVGSKAAQSLCQAGTFTPGTMKIGLVNDGIGIDFVTTSGTPEYDTNCTAWSDK